MSSIIVTAVDGVRELLQTQSDALGFVRTFTAERLYRADRPLTDDELHVDVVHQANEVAITAAARMPMKYAIPVGIAIRKRFDESELDENTGFGARDEIDQLMELTEQICEYLNGKVLASGIAANGPANIVTIAPDNYFAEFQQFYALVRIEMVHHKSAS